MALLRSFSPVTVERSRRDFRFFWASPKRDEAGKTFSKGERRARMKFAQAVAAGAMGLEWCIAEALQLTLRPPPDAWEEAEWKAYWSYERLVSIAERWLIHPIVQEEVQRQKKLIAAEWDLKAGLPARVLGEIAGNKNNPTRERIAAARALQESLALRKPTTTPEALRAVKDKARAAMEAPPPARSSTDEDGGDVDGDAAS